MTQSQSQPTVGSVPATEAGHCVVVSGLPRSGTSMMMRSLAIGGLPPLTDVERVADRDNPNGYYEFEPVKNTENDASWLPEAADKAVKMVYSLVYDLPTNYRYDIVVMRRDMTEILASQAKMLERLGTGGPSPPDEVIARLFNKELDKFREWSSQQSHVRILEVFYNDIIAAPREQFERIQTFISRPLDIAAMVEVVDPSLYRNRANGAAS